MSLIESKSMINGSSGLFEMNLFQHPPMGDIRSRTKRKPRILIVTPEISFLPAGSEGLTTRICAKAGGLADVAALLLDTLTKQGADVHVALPHYRRLFGVVSSALPNDDWRNYNRKSHNTNLHLAEDRSFYYRDKVYSHKNPEVALAFQREVLNNIIPRVQPDIIHCHDWMTGIIPAAARRLNIPCVFTIHNIHTERLSLAHMEHMGIDAAEFWQSLYLERYPQNYEESRNHNPVNLLTSGICASSFVNTVSPSFLDEMINNQHGELPRVVRDHLAHMRETGYAAGILNAPHPSYDPAIDPALAQPYDPVSAVQGKAANKLAFQKRTGLSPDPDAPLFFWPSRLDPTQKGCQLLSDILHQVILDYGVSGLQVALLADGAFQGHFKSIVDLHGIHDRVAVCDFNEDLSRLGYAASDFTLVPSSYEPCGLAQMIAALYGSLPVVHRTGGLSDTVTHIDADEYTGNGFVFEIFDSRGLRWAIDEAMQFYRSDLEWRSGQTARIMRESKQRFDPMATVESYLGIFERLAKCPIT
ncbi:MAG: starch synthase [Cryomorphaceae bacterium]|jgi:starch synthase